MLVDPVPPPALLAVFKSPTSVQLLPSQVSVSLSCAVPTPPKAKAAVYVPAPCICLLAVFKSETSVQLEPLYFSVAAVAGGVSPPKANASF